MDAVSNPFASGAGTPPPELAGRDELREIVRIAIQRVRRGLPTKSDELQYVEEDELAALIIARHRTAQRRLPIVLLGVGLPQLRGHMGRAKSNAERLFDFPEDRCSRSRRRENRDRKAPQPRKESRQTKGTRGRAHAGLAEIIDNPAAKGNNCAALKPHTC